MTLAVPVFRARTSPATESTTATLVSLDCHPYVNTGPLSCGQTEWLAFARTVSPGCRVAYGGDTVIDGKEQSGSICTVFVPSALQPVKSATNPTATRETLMLISR
jgi:hypothetical protein